jgi:hypothetical protein
MIDLSDERFEGMLKVDGFDDCVIGICQRSAHEDILAYSADKIVDKLMKLDGMSKDEAWEHFYYNIESAWMGDTTPCFICSLDDE